jgi:hypothetical protein
MVAERRKRDPPVQSVQHGQLLATNRPYGARCIPPSSERDETRRRRRDRYVRRLAIMAIIMIAG